MQQGPDAITCNHKKKETSGEKKNGARQEPGSFLPTTTARSCAVNPSPLEGAGASGLCHTKCRGSVTKKFHHNTTKKKNGSVPKKDAVSREKIPKKHVSAAAPNHREAIVCCGTKKSQAQKGNCSHKGFKKALRSRGTAKRMSDRPPKVRPKSIRD